jgi:hypothetical protein
MHRLTLFALVNPEQMVSEYVPSASCGLKQEQQDATQIALYV